MSAILPSRRHPGTAMPAAKAKQMRAAATAHVLPYWRAGREHATGRERELMDAVLAGATGDAEIEGARAVMLGLAHHVRLAPPKALPAGLAESLVVGWEPVLAVSAARWSWPRELRFPSSTRVAGTWAPGKVWVLGDAAGRAGCEVKNGLVGVWGGLRGVLARTDDATYRRAVAAAERLRETAEDALRCAIAFAFPDEPAWAREEARGWCARAGEYTDWSGYLLLASIDDARVLGDMVEVIGAGYPPKDMTTFLSWLATAIDRIGLAAARPAIAKLASHATRANVRRAFDALLAP